MGYQYVNRPIKAPGFIETTSPKVSPLVGFQEQGGGFRSTAGSTAGFLREYVQTVANGSATALLGFGWSVLSSSSAATAYTLANIPKGTSKMLVLQKGTTTNTATCILAAGQYLQQSSNSTATTVRKMTFNDGLDKINLYAMSSVKIAWDAVGVTVGAT